MSVISFTTIELEEGDGVLNDAEDGVMNEDEVEKEVDILLFKLLLLLEGMRKDEDEFDSEFAKKLGEEADEGKLTL